MKENFFWGGGPGGQGCIITEQLLHKAEYDMKSYADRGGYPPKPKA